MERYEGTGGVIALLLVVVAVAAMAEVVAGRAVVTSERARTAAWASTARLGDEARARGDVPAARRAYLATLFRARGERSLAGVVWAAERFEGLGDREVVAHALQVAAGLALDGVDEDLGERLQALRDRLDPGAATPLAVGARQ